MVISTCAGLCGRQVISGGGADERNCKIWDTGSVLFSRRWAVCLRRFRDRSPRCASESFQRDLLVRRPLCVATRWIPKKELFIHVRRPQEMSLPRPSYVRNHPPKVIAACATQSAGPRTAKTGTGTFYT